MMTLTQITANEWTVADRLDRVLATFEADDSIDAMSFVAREYPCQPCELNVQDYEAGLAAVLEDCCIAA